MPEISEKADGSGLLGPVFTLGTANSACSAAFYARISGIRANPLKYTDPDGRNAYNSAGEDIYVRNEDGDLFCVPDGEMYQGKIDGVIFQDGTVAKVSDKFLPIDVDIVATKKNGIYSASFVSEEDAVQNNILDVVKGRSGDQSGIFSRDYVQEGRGYFDDRWKINEINENPDWVEWNSPLVRKILPSEMEAINSSIHNKALELKKDFSHNYTTIQIK
jgi:hypothetical protein